MMKSIEVVAAVIFDEQGRIFATQRVYGYEMVFGLLLMAGNRHLAMQLNKRQTRTHHAASCRHPQPQFTCSCKKNGKKLLLR